MSRTPRRRRRPKFTHKRSAPPGAVPGNLDQATATMSEPLSLVGYNAEEVETTEASTPEAIARMRARWAVTWVGSCGPVDSASLQGLAEAFTLHPLALEDVVNLRQRPKVEAFGDHFFLVLQVPSSQDIQATAQISLFCGPGFVLTFQEEPSDQLGPIRERILKGAGRVRRSDAGYLAYAIIDLAIDLYFPLLEQLGDRLEAIEDKLLENPEQALLAEVYDLRRTLMALRRAVWPLREVIASLLREEDNELISERTRMHLRDCRDHAAQILDLIEVYRETCAGLMEVYISTVGLRTNEVMRVLTIIATLFIPLTFIAGVYGMNFDPSASPLNMPELRWAWGYPMVWGVMILLVGAMLIYFRRKGWLGGTP